MKANEIRATIHETRMALRELAQEHGDEEVRGPESAMVIIAAVQMAFIGEIAAQFSNFNEQLTKMLTEEIEENMTGVELIAAERERQIRVEGFGPEHDDNEHEDGDLASAAECYTAYATDQLGGHNPVDVTPMQWPWAPEWWKPSADPTRNLAKAGALIAAELDRLERKKA